jgi:hypothetical protein
MKVGAGWITISVGAGSVGVAVERKMGNTGGVGVDETPHNEGWQADKTKIPIKPKYQLRFFINGQ